MIHEYYMREAIREAKLAMENDEVPIGAVIVCNNKIIARGHNQVELLKDVTAHAEMICLTAASNALNSKYLTTSEIYVTLEPCMMCATAISWAQISKIYYAASDIKKGFTLFDPSPFNGKVIINKGLCEAEASLLLKNFFISKRK